jgi:hypothetical protein
MGLSTLYLVLTATSANGVGGTATNHGATSGSTRGIKRTLNVLPADRASEGRGIINKILNGPDRLANIAAIDKIVHDSTGFRARDISFRHRFTFPRC